MCRSCASSCEYAFGCFPMILKRSCLSYQRTPACRTVVIELSQSFLTLHPNYTNTDFEGLVRELQNRGYGWLRPEGVRAKLEELRGGWRERIKGLSTSPTARDFLLACQDYTPNIVLFLTIYIDNASIHMLP